MANKLYEFMSYESASIQLEHVTNSEGVKDLYMKGIFIQADKRNQNQRVYPLNEISKAVTSVNEKLQGGYTVLGELDHPEELSINLDRVSHMITEMWMDGSNGFGKLKLVPTPVGNIVRTLLESGAKLGVSSRGSGNVDANGYVSDFDIITVDIVAQPSAPDAYPKTIYESLYNMKGGSQIIETASAVNYDPAAQKYLERDIIKLIKELKL